MSSGEPRRSGLLVTELGLLQSSNKHWENIIYKILLPGHLTASTQSRIAPMVMVLVRRSVSLSSSTWKATQSGERTTTTTQTSDWLLPGWGPREPSFHSSKRGRNMSLGLKQRSRVRKRFCRFQWQRSRVTSSPRECKPTTGWACWHSCYVAAAERREAARPHTHLALYCQVTLNRHGRRAGDTPGQTRMPYGVLLERQMVLNDEIGCGAITRITQLVKHVRMVWRHLV